MKERKIKTSVYLPESLHKEIVSRLHSKGRSLNHLIVETIQHILQKEVEKEKASIRQQRTVKVEELQELNRPKRKLSPTITAEELLKGISID
jgi:hypothetical protein